MKHEITYEEIKESYADINNIISHTVKLLKGYLRYKTTFCYKVALNV